MSAPWSHADARPVERLPIPSPSAFRGLVAVGRPVVLEGLAARWPACQRWSEDYLRRTVGGHGVNVEVYPDGDHADLMTVDRRRMSLAEYLDALNAARGDEALYLGGARLPETLPPLWGDLEVPGHVDRRRLELTLLFLGRDSATTGHFHTKHQALLCQLRGEKQLLLYPPDATPSLQPYPWHHAAFGFSRERAPWKQEDASGALIATLTPGDALFIPVHWWHWVASPQFTAAVTFFWKAPLIEWALPRPGLDCLVGVPLQSLRVAHAKLRSRLGI